MWFGADQGHPVTRWHCHRPAGPGCSAFKAQTQQRTCQVPSIAPGKEGQQRREGSRCEAHGVPQGNASPSPGASVLTSTLPHPAPAALPAPSGPSSPCSRPPRFTLVVCSPESCSHSATSVGGPLVANLGAAQHHTCL